jgi:hypothetical protein
MKLKITGIGDVDGEYPVEFAHFKNSEHRSIFKIANIGILEYQDALERGNIEFLAAVAKIVVARHGKELDLDAFWAADDTALEWVPEVGDDAGPPVVKNKPEPVAEKINSGEGSWDSMAPYPVTLTETGYGFQNSDTGSDSDPATFFSSLQAN